MSSRHARPAARVRGKAAAARARVTALRSRTAKGAARLHREFEACTHLSLWRELLVPFDWLALRASRVWSGTGVPRGDGSAVITIPGFLGTDFYLRELGAWLGRVGYRHVPSGIARNADCPDVLQRRLLETIERAVAKTGGPVHLVGHSLGGVLARSTAVQYPKLVASLTMLGSPFRGVRSHPLMLRISEAIRQSIVSQADCERPSECYTGQCTCPFFEALDRAPRAVRELAVYTKEDGVVDWELCRTGDPARDREVKGTHSGLAFNPQVFKLLGQFLAATPAPARRAA